MVGRQEAPPHNFFFMAYDHIDTRFAPLLLDYGPPRALLLADVAPQALLLGGLLALCGWGLLRHPRLAYPGLWFFILLAPSSSVVPIAEEWAAERRVYLALAGPLALVCVAA